VSREPAVAAELRAPLISGLSQYEVDFVIPRAGVDLPLGIDPFLLYKSRDPALRALHGTLVGAFNSGIAAVARGDMEDAERRFDFPEVSEIGLGYTRVGKRGSGVGTVLRGLILDTLTHSPGLLEGGVRHIEEMQLLSAGIGADRVSDIAANVLKRFLVEYTQRQCAMWGVPIQPGVALAHVYDPETGEWEDGFYDLPVSPIDGAAILLVPRRVVRTLPWINYDDFVRGEFSAYLKVKREAAVRAARLADGGRGGPSAPQPAKRDVVSVTRGDIALVERYVRAREAAADQAQPATEYGGGDGVCGDSAVLAQRLDATPTGAAAAGDYQRVVVEVLNLVFSPDLVDGQMEVRTVDGTERRDIVFTNESDQSFWQYVRAEHSGIFLMFEVKNTEALRPDALNQTATYLGDRLGRLGLIVTRVAPSDATRRKAMSIWNDSGMARKAILILSDADLKALLEVRCQGRSPRAGCSNATATSAWPSSSGQ
jgi:hypothetical protein